MYDVFVMMGDGEKVIVKRYGTVRIKINGNVCVLKNTLHVPTLDCNLFSAVFHGCNGQGCVFMLGNNEMHLSFPHFEITQEIPQDFDLRVDLEPLEESDWHFSHYTCDGNEEEDLSTLKSQLHFLNRIFHGRAVTRIQHKKNLE